MGLLAAPGNKQIIQNPQQVTEAEELQSTIKLLDYAECDIALSTDEIRRIIEITKDLRKSLKKISKTIQGT